MTHADGKTSAGLLGGTEQKRHHHWGEGHRREKQTKPLLDRGDSPSQDTHSTSEGAVSSEF